MAETYTKPQTVDGTAGGDTVKNAIMNKIEVNAAGIVSDLNIHAALTTSTHGLGSAAFVSTGAFDAAGLVSTHAALTTSAHGLPAASAAWVSTGALAQSGANSDITSLSGITGDITGPGAVTIAAGGTNQNVTLTPSGTGNVNVSTYGGLFADENGFSIQANNGDSEASSLWFDTQSTHKMVLDKSGNFGINVTIPLRKFHVHTGTDQNIVVRSGSDFGAGYSGIAVDAPNDVNSNRDMFVIAGNPIVLTAGNVGIGVTGPTYRIQLPNVSDATGQGQANAWVTYSSIRWKENITPLSGTLDKISQLNPVYFDWKPENGGAHDLGFIAEEVGKIVPEVVTWEADGVYAKAMDYGKLSALAIAGVQELSAKVLELNAKVLELQQLLAKK